MHKQASRLGWRYVIRVGSAIDEMLMEMEKKPAKSTDIDIPTLLP